MTAKTIKLTMSPMIQNSEKMKVKDLIKIVIIDKL